MAKDFYHTLVKKALTDEVIAEANSRGLTHEMTSCEN